MNTKGHGFGARFTYPQGPTYLRQDFLAWGPQEIYICKVISVPVHGESCRFPTDKIEMTGIPDCNGPEMSTGRGILRNTCIGSWTLYDLTSQSEHYLLAPSTKNK